MGGVDDYVRPADDLPEDDAERADKPRTEKKKVAPNNSGGGLRAAIVIAAISVFFGVASAVAVTALGLNPLSTARTASAPSVRESKPAHSFAGMSLDEILRKGGDLYDQADYEGAAMAFERALADEDADFQRMIYADFMRAASLSRAGAIDDVPELLALVVSKPGDELWLRVMVEKVEMSSAINDTNLMKRALYTIAANASRYPRHWRIEDWVNYKLAMTRATALMESCRAELPGGLATDKLGKGVIGMEAFSLDHVPMKPRGVEEPAVKVEREPGRVRIEATGVTFRELFDEIEKNFDFSIEIEDAEFEESPAFARIAGVSIDRALEILAGSLGCEPVVAENDATISVRPFALESPDDEGYFNATISALQEFTIIHADSPFVPEASYAAAALLAADGRDRMALGQLEILLENHPRSDWAAPGGLLAGRLRLKHEDYDGALNSFLRVVDMDISEEVKAEALWLAGYSHLRGERYGEAIKLLRDALEGDLPETYEPAAAFYAAFALEKRGGAPAAVEQHYRDVIIRYGRADYALLARYRLAEIAADYGNYQLAASRLEDFIEHTSPESPDFREALFRLLDVHLKAGNSMSAVVAASLIRQKFLVDATYPKALPSALEAFAENEAYELALEVIDEAKDKYPQMDDRLRTELEIRRAEYLLGLDRIEDAHDAVVELLASDIENDLKCRAKLIAAEICLAAGDYRRALRKAHEVVGESGDETRRAEALELMGRAFESLGRYEMAAHAYSGKSPAVLDIEEEEL